MLFCTGSISRLVVRSKKGSKKDNKRHERIPGAPSIVFCRSFKGVKYFGNTRINFNYHVYLCWTYFVKDLKKQGFKDKNFFLYEII